MAKCICIKFKHIHSTMTNNFHLLKSVISYIEKYEIEVGNSDIKEFSIFLKEELFNESSLKTTETFDKNNFAEYKSYAEVEFSTLLTNLYRFAKHYYKKAFIGTNIKTIDEFGFLASLLRQKSMLKNELINQHLLETSSGSEILKRMIKNGLIKEVADEIDKRAKRVSLTALGAQTILGTFEKMHTVSEIIIGNLNKDEVSQTLQTFNKLSYFHQHIYELDRNKSIKQLYEKHIAIQND